MFDKNVSIEATKVALSAYTLFTKIGGNSFGGSLR